MDNKAYSKKITACAYGIIAFSSLFVFGAYSPVDAASLSFSPSVGSYAVGDTVSVVVSLESSSQSANAVSGDIVIPGDTFRYTSFSKSGSIISLWAEEPSFSASNGTFHFEGVILNPGYQGSQGKIVTISLKALRAGSATFSLSSGAVLANDGKGTNIIEGLGKASYVITPASASSLPKSKEEVNLALPQAPAVTSASHPDPERWYASKDISLAWDVPDGVDDVSYAIHTSLDFVPGIAQHKGVLTRAMYKAEDYGDGTWYFHIRFHGSAGWGPTTSRKIRIDMTPPDVPRITREYANDDATDPQPILSFSSHDAKSGIAKYEVYIGEGNSIVVLPEEAKRYHMPIQGPGDHRVRVRAIDGAGNFAEGEITVNVAPIAKPIILDYTKTIHSPQEELTASGQAIPGAIVRLSLISGASRISFSAQANNEGVWSVSYGDPIMAGSWTLSAHAEDIRGAVSEETKGVTVSVQAWAWNAVRQFIGGGFVVLALIAIGFGICYVWLVLFHHVRMARTRMQKDLLAFKKELQRDMAHLDEDIASLERSNSVNLKTGVQRKGHLAGDVRHIQSDIEKELKKIEGD